MVNTPLVQDFLNNVCTHIVHLDHTHKELVYYRGNYDMFCEVGWEGVGGGGSLLTSVTTAWEPACLPV